VRVQTRLSALICATILMMAAMAGCSSQGQKASDEDIEKTISAGVAKSSQPPASGATVPGATSARGPVPR
jgi:outer membrane protein assembly factor BamE (lipoprotein component of BamABCDE complex)